MAETRRAIRDWDRADAWLSLASLALVVVISLVGSSIGRELAPIQAISLLAFLAHPYFLIRVIRHFRPVPEWWTRGLLAAAIVGTAVAAALPSPRPITFRVVAILFVGSTIMGASVTLAATARRYRGLAAWRLNFAAVEAALVLVVLLLLVVAATDDGYVFVLDHLGSNRNLSFALAACYYFGLLPPRRLRRALLRSVEYQFLRRTSEHPPNDRGRLITIDLAHAVAHGVPNAGTLVLIGNGTLHVAASSVPGARGINLPASAAAGRAVSLADTITGDVTELEPELQALAVGAQHFLALPIVGTRPWGTLIVLQFRPSLFPTDDRDLLKRLCRYTAEALDQGQLLADERARQARDAAAHLDLILESLQDYAVITIDDAGVVTSWNTGAAQMFQHETAAAVGRSVTELFADDAPWLEDQLQHARIGEPVSSDTTARRRDGTTLTTSLVIRPLGGRNRPRVGFVLVMRDITQRRALEDRLRQSQKLEAIGRLAAGVAHDFNNMLTVIIGYAQNLDEVLADEHRGPLGEIRRAGERAAALTKQLLQFSRQQAYHAERLHLADVVVGLVPMLARLLGEHIEIVDVVDPSTPPIVADRAQLEQVVINLSVNARDAMPGGGRLAIRVQDVTLTPAQSATLDVAPGRYALLEVADTGSGVDLVTKSRMFEPFFTTKEVGRGTGLGLAIVYGVVQEMSGAVEVDSELGHGTTFRIYIPAADH